MYSHQDRYFSAFTRILMKHVFVSLWWWFLSMLRLEKGFSKMYFMFGIKYQSLANFFWQGLWYLASSHWKYVVLAASLKAALFLESRAILQDHGKWGDCRGSLVKGFANLRQGFKIFFKFNRSVHVLQRCVCVGSCLPCVSS